MQPFTFDQSIIAGLLFLLGLVIGMYFLAGSKWKRRYTHESSRVHALEAENEQLRRDAREMESLRNAAVRTPMQEMPAESSAYRENQPRPDAAPDIIVRRP